MFSATPVNQIFDPPPPIVSVFTLTWLQFAQTCFLWRSQILEKKTKTICISETKYYQWICKKRSLKRRPKHVFPVPVPAVGAACI
jgi:hypothetical protein